MITAAAQSPAVSRALEDFQRFVLAQVRERRSRWGSQSQKLCQAVATELVKASDQVQPPVDLYKIAEFIGIDVRDELANGGSEMGAIWTTDERITVAVRRSLGRERQRFILAHELGHTLFFYRTVAGYQRLLPATSNPNSHGHLREEGLCDAFARALLIPSVLASCFTVDPPSFERLMALSDRLVVSPSVLLRRVMHDLDGWSDEICYAIYKGESTRVVSFIGRARKKARGAAPSRGAVLRWAATKDVGELVGVLAHSERVREIFWRPNSRVVWVRA